MANLGADIFDFTNLLARPLLRDPVWRDLADACNKVLGREVEERRRRLQSSRDSVKNRKGDILSQINYLPEDGKPALDAATGLPTTELVGGERISKAIITRVISNVGIYGSTNATDYFQVEFKSPGGRTLQWLMPIDAPQERPLLLKNAYNLGFDFFNTELSTEDYQRLYEYLDMFWWENGPNDNFIKFIGFVKNLRLDMEPLWAFDDGTDIISDLEPLNADRIKASEGGPWYLTSHVEVRYDLKLQSALQGINLTQLERLFYIFAPIMLVLERIIGTLDVEFPIAVSNSAQLEVINYGISGLNLNIEFDINTLQSVQLSVYNYGIFENYQDWEYLVIANPMNEIVNHEFLTLQQLNEELALLSNLS